MLPEYESELVKEIRMEVEAIRNYVTSILVEEMATQKLRRLDRITTICGILLDERPSIISPEPSL
jgi:hypothetical protein